MKTRIPIKTPKIDGPGKMNLTINIAGFEHKVIITDWLSENVLIVTTGPTKEQAVVIPVAFITQ